MENIIKDEDRMEIPQSNMFLGLPITYDDGNEKYDALITKIAPMYDPWTFKEACKLFIAQKINSDGQLTDEVLVVNSTKFKYINFKHE